MKILKLKTITDRKLTDKVISSSSSSNKNIPEDMRETTGKMMLGKRVAYLSDVKLFLFCIIKTVTIPIYLKS